MFVQKLLKPTLAAAAVVGAFAVAPAAQAGTDIDLYLGFGDAPWGYHDTGVYVEPGYGGHFGHGHYGHRISCWEGKQRVKWAGFRKVQPLDCDGRRYSYRAKKHGEWFLVTVNSRRGHIVDVSEY